MKTLLCAVNSKYIHSSPAVHSIKKACEHYSRMYSSETGDICVREYSVNDAYEAVLYGIVSEIPDCVCFSVYIWNVKYISSLCLDVRKMLPGACIVIGGPEVSFGIDEKFFPNESFDYVSAGEGERAMFCLLSEIYAKRNNRCFIPPEHFGYEKKGKEVSAAEIEDLAELPFIYDTGNLSCFENRIIYYETSRGCPFNCAYCLSGAESRVSFLSIERVLAEIDFFNDNKVKQVKFVDRTFNCNQKRAKNIVRHIISLEECKTNFHFEVGADLFDDEFTELLSKAPKGRIQIEAGIQSLYEPALNACCRKMNLEKCFKNLQRIIEAGNINVHTDLIAGLPYETAEIFEDSFNRTYSLKSHQLQLGFLKLLRGAPLNSMTDEHGYVFSDNPPYEIVRNNYITTAELLKLKETENVLERFYNSGHFAYTVDEIEKNYSTPFEMFREIAEFAVKRKCVFKAMSMQQSFDLLNDFITEKFAHCEICDSEIGNGYMDKLRRLMLLDYFSSNKSDLPPESLKNLWTPERVIKYKNSDIMKEYGIEGFKNSRLRVIGGEIFIFDFSDVNPVTGRFKYIKTKYTV